MEAKRHIGITFYLTSDKLLGESWIVIGLSRSRDDVDSSVTFKLIPGFVPRYFSFVFFSSINKSRLAQYKTYLSRVARWLGN